MNNAITERSARYQDEINKANQRRYVIEGQIADLTDDLAAVKDRLHLLNGAAQEAGLAAKDLDTLQAVSDAQAEEIEKGKPKLKRVKK